MRITKQTIIDQLERIAKGMFVSNKDKIKALEMIIKLKHWFDPPTMKEKLQELAEQVLEANGGKVVVKSAEEMFPDIHPDNWGYKEGEKKP